MLVALVVGYGETFDESFNENCVFGVLLDWVWEVDIYSFFEHLVELV